MPDADLAHALRMAPDPIKAWLYLAAYGGLRCCEIARLRGEDYMQARSLLVVREQKGGDTAAIHVGPVLAETVDWLPERGWWFPRWDGVPGPISAGQLQRHGNRWLHSQGITATMHTARHWHGTYIYRSSGRDLRLTQEVMRHKSPVSTAVYTYIDPYETASVVARLPRL